jgi:hypothetical protein
MVSRQGSKQDRFVRLAEKRVSELLDKFRLVGNLADRRNYAYTDEQIRLILKAVEDEVRALRVKFTMSNTSKEKTFSLSEITRKNERTD